MTILTKQETIAHRYLIGQKLGRGGSAITYEARDLETNQQVALKAISLQQLKAWDKLDSFEREAKILKQLEHEAIPRYIDDFKIDKEGDKLFCIVQQLAPGKSLATLVEGGWRSDLTTAKEIAVQLLNILIYLQELNPPVIHRDLKPHNIIYNPANKQLFLVDFGTVRDRYGHTVTGTLAVGTPGYMAPEQLQGGANLTTDLYGLGTTLLFLLTGEPPDELPLKKLKIDFRSQVKLAGNFANWLDKLIEPYKEDRLPSAKAALAVLEGRAELKDYRSLTQLRPVYTSIKIKKSEQELEITVPPALFRRRYNKLVPLATLAGYGGLFLLFFAIASSTHIMVVLVYLILVIAQTYGGWWIKSAKRFRIVFLLGLGIYSLLNWKLRLGLILGAILLGGDLYFNGEEGRKKVLAYLLLKTRISMRSTSKTFKLEQFLFSKVVSKRKENKNEPKTIVSKLGGLLTKGEKYWLEEEINGFRGLK